MEKWRRFSVRASSSFSKRNIQISPSTSLCTRPDPEIHQDGTILVTVHHPLAWKHISEIHVEGTRICPSTVICPEEAEGLTRVVSAQNCCADPGEILWGAYVQIFDDLASWHEDCQPRLVPDDSVREISEAGVESWREESCSTAASGYGLLLENGR